MQGAIYSFREDHAKVKFFKEEIKAEARKEFAERLKNVWGSNYYDSPDIEFDYFVDNLVKETVGDDNEMSETITNDDIIERR